MESKFTRKEIEAASLAELESWIETNKDRKEFADQAMTYHGFLCSVLLRLEKSK